jgi:23S rRNA (cytidine1920-2'-O)/16S rRNA (cytidine1409-2'-O)-methyltransferase
MTVRADQLLVERGLVESRTRAQALILAGLVFTGERRIDKAGQPLAPDAPLDVRGREHPWVSRGGQKLDHALTAFDWDVTGARAMDVGASTGGFTDVLLTRGAAHVVAVDVGHGQLAWKLRSDDRVTVMERVNARHLEAGALPYAPDLIVCDASFIGLAKVLATPLALAAPAARLVALVKPQFEAGRDEIGKGGVVRDPAVHARVVAQARDWAEEQGWRTLDPVQSPITGPEGNIEYLLGAIRSLP